MENANESSKNGITKLAPAENRSKYQILTGNSVKDLAKEALNLRVTHLPSRRVELVVA
jgi:hypothetical protein